MIDKVVVVVKAGNGGNGAVSFRREKFVPFGGPDGGDGGDGGDVLIKAAPGMSNLNAFKHKRHYRAGNGDNGGGQKKHGKGGKPLVLTVPTGTVVLEKTQIGGNEIIVDLAQLGEQVIVAKGGKGGLGNVRFVSSTNQAPRTAQQGEEGEEKSITLEMRLIADVGIIGYPNVGKSSLLAAASAAKPQIASYPFTTREPLLGLVEVGLQRFVLAEIPGLIEDAHLGKGLGHDFLRHISRTRVLVHVIDGSAESPVENMRQVNAELYLFDSALAQKPQIVAVNKIDLPAVRARLIEIKDAFKSIGVKVHFISAATGEGVSKLMAQVMKMLTQTVRLERGDERALAKVFHPQPVDSVIRVQKEGESFVLLTPELERLVAGTDLSIPGIEHELKRQLMRTGVARALKKAGVKPGDKVRCGSLEWEW